MLEWREIARQYALTPPYWFWLDLFGTIPWEALTMLLARAGMRLDSSATRATQLLKLPRLLRLSRLMKNLEALQSGNLVRMFRLLLYFFLCAHWLACLW